MVLAEKWAVDQETKLVMTGDMSADNWSMVDMVKLRLGEVVLWLVWSPGGEVPRVKLGREGLPGSEVEPVRSAWLLLDIILLWRPSMTSLAMEATSVSGSRSRTIKLPNTRR